uniref:Uncharacterized protein n=1 Tax=Micrurus spixii TaxID=129469 RepID=A0A2D4NFR4_9SAUR
MYSQVSQQSDFPLPFRRQCYLLELIGGRRNTKILADILSNLIMGIGRKTIKKLMATPNLSEHSIANSTPVILCSSTCINLIHLQRIYTVIIAHRGRGLRKKVLPHPLIVK